MPCSTHQMRHCPSLGKPDRKTLKALQDPEMGAIGVRVKRARDGNPVLYIWQMFSYVRITWAEAQTLRRLIDEEEVKVQVARLDGNGHKGPPQKRPKTRRKQSI